jgi:hypothetical protein
VPLTRKWSAEEPEAILDYLHGDTPRDEAKPCCYYEYARTSDVFQRARKELEAVKAGDPLHTVIDEFPLFRDNWQRLEILICRGFPTRPWRDLSEAQRKKIAVHFVETRPPSLISIITQSFILDKMGIFDRFKEQAASDYREWKKHRGHYPAIVGDNAIKYVVLAINYAEGKDVTKEAVTRWLNTEANRKFFRKYYKKPIHKQNPDSPDRYKELLKYLAAWRLYDELGLKSAKEWTKGNRRHSAYHLRPFFKERLRKTPGGMHYGGSVFKERRQWKDAIANAKSFLATEIERGSGMT